ncbi:hypothetical protein [Nocardia cyriacigeorgica]|uniref:hypothetical protein n=1 Tax=Nocardia cyriacigeorgica TaxID=135487 RepID=UPI001893A740|nr:hypothetical protein [Nocardia cyriacigeorgica]MBF6452524.1 hypothetical protein [Nocardia cyriacigeorgica]MBF6549693.1 hypothetical protein [Nocardia cyriacigeorgica]
MSDRRKFAAVGGALLLLFGVALGIGALVGDQTEPTPAGQPTAPAGHALGLTEHVAGYTLSEISAPETPGRAGTLRFHITGPDGAPVTEFTTQHDKKLHLIVSRSDTTEYRHAHPDMAADGTWSIDWTWDAPGSYRVFADFVPAAGDSPGDLVLGRAVTVAGTVQLQPLPPPSATATVDGYTVTRAGALTTAGGELHFDIARDGVPVTDLDPYLGAYAHLVALRTEDLAYLHVHPQGEVGTAPPGPQVSFHAQAPSAGAYRLYLDFSHGGSVHTAEFTVEVSDAAPSTGGHPGGHN